MQLKALSGLLLCTLFLGMAACGSSPTEPGVDPVPVPPGSPRSGGLAITVLAPANGPTSGATAVTIAGTGFEAGATVSFGGDPVVATVREGSTLTAVTPAHAPGAVDVVVTNLDGRSVRIARGFTYHDPSGPPPAVASVSEAIGSTDGGANVVISGTGFLVGAIVTFDGIPGRLGGLSTAFLYEGSLYVTSPPHASGPVELVVTNPDGQSVRVPNGYTYVLPGTLDFNGEWEGGTGTDWLTPVILTIRNNMLVSLTCGNASATLSAPFPVINDGQFSVNADNLTMNGRILTDTSATGTINAAACPSDTWIAGSKTDQYYVTKKP